MLCLVLTGVLAGTQVGAGFWLTDDALLRSKADELAKAQYAVRKDPSDAALMYVALGKKPLLQVGSCAPMAVTSDPALKCRHLLPTGCLPDHSSCLKQAARCSVGTNRV